jgi:hypothetical protein
VRGHVLKGTLLRRLCTGKCKQAVVLDRPGSNASGLLDNQNAYLTFHAAELYRCAEPVRARTAYNRSGSPYIVRRCTSADRNRMARLRGSTPAPNRAGHQNIQRALVLEDMT